MAFYSGVVGPCSWSHIRGGFQGEEFEAFLAYLSGVATRMTEDQLVLDLAFDTPMPTALQRRQIADVISDAPGLELVAGHALVINSAVGRGVLTAINWLARPPFEERLFSQPGAALTWLWERNSSLDRERLMAEIRNTCPGFRELVW